MSKVELSPAYVWDCPSCGRENFQRCISRRLDPDDPDDAAMIRDMHDLAPDQSITDIIRVTWQCRPDRVTCRHCDTEYEAQDVGADDEDES